MKKVFLSLLTFFMVLSLSLVLVKASEATTVELVDGVQIRTDGNNGLRWQASVSNAAENQTYGFLFAQGDLAEVTVETANVVNEQVDGLNEDGTFAATMVKFPKAAATQDISVVAYVKDGENYTYSNVVVRNLSEVAVEAYKNGVEGDFVKAVYDASETTFNLNGGELVADYEFKVTRYNTGSGTGLYIGISPSSNPSGATGLYWHKIYFKYVEELGLYKVVAVAASGTKYSGSDYDYVIGAFESASTCTDKVSHSVIKGIVNMGDKAKELYADFAVPTEAVCDVKVRIFKEISLFANKNHYGGGANLPLATKEYYEFDGWYDNAELNGVALDKQNASRSLYAKFTPINYTIEYSLGAGNCNVELVTSYNYESNEIILPTIDNLTIANGQFGGWFDNVECAGTPITSIPTNSYGNKQFYALWIMDAPTVVETTQADKTIIEKYTPSLFVSQQFTVGKFIINGVEYSTGVNAFATISSALAAAKENDVIYVFGNEYDESVDVNVAGVTLLGANADVDPNNRTRQGETVIKKLTISANNVSFNGFKLGDQLQATTESVLISAGVSNCTLSYTIIAKQTTFSSNSNGLFKCLGTKGNEVNNLTIANFKVEQSPKRPTLFYGYGINNITVKDSVFLGSSEKSLYTDAVKIISSDYGNYGLQGNVTFTGNTFKDYGQYLLWFAKCGNVTINVSNNNFVNCGQTAGSHGALYIAGVASGHTGSTIVMENNVVDNSYMLLRMHSSASKFTAELHNNSILNSKATYHIKNESTSVVNAANNYYDVTPTSAKFMGVSVWEPVLNEDPNK